MLSDDELDLLIMLHAPPIHPDFKDDDDFIELARAIEAAVLPEGWVAVPKEPTVQAKRFDRDVMCGEETMTENNAALIAAPKLAELKSRPCTLEELQAALVNLIELYNKQGEAMNAAINRKQDREWRATI